MVSVPNKTKCRSGVDTNMVREAVGAPDIRVALVAVALLKFESHSKQGQLAIRAITFCPKLSMTHKPGSVTLSVLVDALPQPESLQLVPVFQPGNDHLFLFMLVFRYSFKVFFYKKQ